MVYLLGYNIIESRLVKRALESFYGIGPSGSARIMAKFHIHPLAKVGSLKAHQINDIQQHLSGMSIENDLRRKLIENITRLRDMGAYRGRRHAMGLPVRGQRTRSQITTARTLNRIERRG